MHLAGRARFPRSRCPSEVPLRRARLALAVPTCESEGERRLTFATAPPLNTIGMPSRSGNGTKVQFPP